MKSEEPIPNDMKRKGDHRMPMPVTQGEREKLTRANLRTHLQTSCCCC